MSDSDGYQNWIERLKIEKHIKKQPNMFQWIATCPYCGKILSPNERIVQCECGQLLNWGSVNG